MPTVCMILEGSYPYVVGGVSEWVHKLVTKLPTINFLLWTITPSKNEKIKYELPTNVIGIDNVSFSDKLRFHQPTAGKREQAWQDVELFHQEMLEGNYGHFANILAHLRGNVRKLNVAQILRDEEGWNMVTHYHRRNYPIDAFLKYFWGWRCSHYPIFKMLQAKIPKADIYHAVATGYAGLLGTMAKITTGKPFILTEHGIYTKEREMEINKTKLLQGYEKRLWNKIFRGLARLAYYHADLITTLFKNNFQYQIDMGADPTKCRIIPNGIEVQNFLNLPKEVHNSKFNVGIVARVTPIKDIKTFIFAAKIISLELANTHFYVIGPYDENGQYYHECRMLVENLGLEDRITFTGRVDVRKYYARLDLMMLTSIKEAQPLTIIEAMCAEVPVVATDVGNVTELLQDDGIVVPPKDPYALAQGAVKILTDRNYATRITKRARARAAATYDFDQVVQRYEKIYSAYFTRGRRSGLVGKLTETPVVEPDKSRETSGVFKIRPSDSRGVRVFGQRPGQAFD